MTVEAGQMVRLKPKRAQAYGLEPSTVYRVLSVVERPGYAVPFVQLEGGEMVAPYNIVKATELRS